MSWIYYILGSVVSVVAIVAFLLYRGYKKVRPKPIAGIPYPPFTHSILGHPERMMHPLKHELRLEICDASTAPIHQLLMMKHSSVFINDASLAKQVLEDLPTKGSLYNAYRYDQNVPDILASDGNDYKLRVDALKSSFENLKIPKNHSSFNELIEVFVKYAETNEACDLKKLSSLFSLDFICSVIFGYELGAVSGSEEGEKLYDSLNTFYDAQNASGIYILDDMRKVSSEELSESKQIWKEFLMKLCNVCRTNAQDSSYPICSSLNHLSQLPGVGQDSEIVLISEIHQILKHAHESIAGMMLWIVYALHRNPKIRAKLEIEIENSPNSNYTSMFLQEVLRRYPVAGGMTVRVVDDDDGYCPMNGILIPKGTPVHMHIWSLQNTNRVWENPKEFNPDRWAESKSNSKCPFSWFAKEGDIFSGCGNKCDSLTFFPFSAGNRQCLGKSIAIEILLRLITEVFSKFRLDPSEQFWDEDLGISVHATIVPRLKKSYLLKIKRVVQAGTLDIKEVTETEKNQGGWASDED